MTADEIKRRLREPDAQLVDTLRRHEVDAVVDVGANCGQYVSRLRAAGWTGQILSIEPIPELQAELCRRAATDPDWEIAPPVAVGAAAGDTLLEVSAESDMSSTLAQSDLLRAISPTSAISRRISVPQYRLDGPELLGVRAWKRMFVKIDVQGAEPAVLAGLDGAWNRVRGLQLELALLPLYDGERPWREVVDLMAARGLSPHLVFPGYYARALGRQVQVDMVFYRD